jgi:hypothetical protein
VIGLLYPLALLLAPPADCAGQPAGALAAVPLRALATGQDLTLDQLKIRPAPCALTVSREPVSIGLLLDLSGSMEMNHIALARQSAAFLLSLAAGDEDFCVTLVTANQPQPCEFGHDLRPLQQAFHLRPTGRSPLLDAMHGALRSMDGARHPNRVLFILSDGEDNYLRRSEAELRRLVLVSRTPVYLLLFRRPRWPSDPLRAEDMQALLVADLARLSGGFVAPVRTRAELDSLAPALLASARTAYTLYYPSKPGARPAVPRMSPKLLPQNWQVSLGPVYLPR